MSILPARGHRSGVRHTARMGAASLLTAVTAMLILHLVAYGRTDPMSSTLSNYIFVPGYGWLFPTAVLATAGAGFAVLYELTRSLPQPRLSLRLTVLLASLCCLLVALFPTDRAGPLTLSAEIHRYAAGAAFCCVPLAAWLLSRDPFVLRTRTHHAARLHRMTVVSAVILVVVLTSQLGLLPDAEHRIRGLLQ